MRAPAAGAGCSFCSLVAGGCHWKGLRRRMSWQEPAAASAASAPAAAVAAEAEAGLLQGAETARPQFLLLGRRRRKRSQGQQLQQLLLLQLYEEGSLQR